MSVRERRRRWPLAALVIAGLVALAALWLVLPWRIGAVAVETVRALPPGEPDGSRRLPPLATPVRIAVTFSTPLPLDQVRRARGLGWIGGQLSDCDHPARATEEPIGPTGYRADEGRGVELPSANGRSRYLVTFDTRLSETVDHQGRDYAVRSGTALCFAVVGSNMISRLTSNVVRLRVDLADR